MLRSGHDELDLVQIEQEVEQEVAKAEWEAAELAVDAVARLTQDLNIPTLPEMGIPEEDVPMLAELAYNDPQTIGNPRDIAFVVDLSGSMQAEDFTDDTGKSVDRLTAVVLDDGDGAVDRVIALVDH